MVHEDLPLPLEHTPDTWRDHIGFPLWPQAALLDPAAQALLEERLLLAVTCLERVTVRCRDDKDLLSFLGLPPLLQQWALQEPPLPRGGLDYCRLDLAGRRTGDVRILEFNGGCPLGLISAGLLVRHWRRHHPGLAEALRGRDTVPFPLEGETWFVDALTRLAAEREPTATEPPGTLTIVCDPGAERFIETAELLAQAHRRGIDANLTAGEHLTTASSGPASLGFLLHDLPSFIDRLPGRQGLCEAMADGRMTVPNGLLGRAVGDNKLGMAVLSDPRFAGLFSEHERRILASVVPWSRKLGDGVTTREVLDARESLVLKPPFGARSEGILVGRFCTEEQWREAASSPACAGWLVQEYVAPEELADPGGSTPLHRIMAAGFLGGRPVGWVSRVSTTIVSNSGPGWGMQVVLAAGGRR
ncbi:hypothetical protein ACFY2W_22395 [Streptomyces sp. NPDC001262]|uniref:hypothetical protein n=1 Tax=unclassified Streptomyces TaxID=2593676 RepID=UPI0036D0837B